MDPKQSLECGEVSSGTCVTGTFLRLIVCSGGSSRLPFSRRCSLLLKTSYTKLFHSNPCLLVSSRNFAYEAYHCSYSCRIWWNIRSLACYSGRRRHKASTTCGNPANERCSQSAVSLTTFSLEPILWLSSIFGARVCQASLCSRSTTWSSAEAGPHAHFAHIVVAAMGLHDERRRGC
jgi:hypothetical protein